MAVKKQSGATVKKKTKKEESSSEEEEEEQTTRGVKRKREKDSEKPAAKKKKATPSKKLKKKKKRDPKEPKKPISGYLRFCEEFRPQVHENLKTKGVKLVSKELGKMWKELDPKAKEEYNNAFKKENEVFLEVFKEYKANKSSSEEEEEEEEEEAKKTPKKKKKDPNAPKRPLTGYMLYSKEKRSEVVAENPQLKNADVARELGRRWKALSEADRASYSKNYKEQKQQYDADFKQYKEEHPSSDESSEEEPEVKTPSKTSKKKKDPNAPKGPPNSFNLYSSEIRQSVKDENPTLDHKEIAKIIGQKWKALSDTEKEKYTKEASSKKEAFMQEFKDYTANQKKQEKIEKIEKKTKKTASTSSTTTPVKRKKNNVIDDEDEDEESDEEESGEEESGEESGDSSSDSSDSDDE